MTDKIIPLYGGSITVSLPSELIDASAFRQIPDTQEVYVSPDGVVSVIIDLLECVTATTLDSALDAHINELNAINGSPSSCVFNTIPIEPKGAEPLAQANFTGVRVILQKVAKFGRPWDTDTVLAAVGLLRLAAPISTDVLITVNSKIEDHQQNQQNQQQNQQTAQQIQNLASNILASFAVKNTNLFTT
jgi:hypothetical protein